MHSPQRWPRPTSASAPPETHTRLRCGPCRPRSRARAVRAPACQSARQLAALCALCQVFLGLRPTALARLRGQDAMETISGPVGIRHQRREARGSSTSSVQRAATLRAHAPRQRWHWLAGVPRRRVAGTGEQRGQRSGEPTVDRYMPPCPPASQPACLSAFPRPAAASSTPGAQPPTYLSVHWPAPCIPPHDGTVQSPAAYSAERAAAASCITLHDDASWPPPPPRRPTPLHPLQRGQSARPPSCGRATLALGPGPGPGATNKHYVVVVAMRLWSFES